MSQREMTEGRKTAHFNSEDTEAYQRLSCILLVHHILLQASFAYICFMFRLTALYWRLSYPIRANSNFVS